MYLNETKAKDMEGENLCSKKIDIVENGVNHNLLNAMKLLHSEYEKWAKANGNNFSLVSESIVDGQINLEFVIDSETKFKIICPSGYPNYEDNFFVESSSHDLWCNCLNEFILDSNKKHTLDVILNKAHSLYFKNSHTTLDSSSSDSETDGEEYLLIDECDVEERMYEEKKKLWRQKESFIRASNQKPKTSDMFQGTVKDHPQQVFSNSAASGILTNDLVNIMKSAKETGINADPVEDNIYQWFVYLSGFNPEGNLSKDLKKVLEMYGYNYIQLQLDFKMDLYPFYPPGVKVVRPRFSGSTMLPVQGLNLFKLSSWNPARDMKSVLEEVKQHLENVRLDVKSSRNDRNIFPETSYFDIENHLLTLACVSETSPNNLSYEVKSANINLKKELFRNQFPSGIGFSTDIHTGWDINAYNAAQKEKDKQIESVLKKILIELAKTCNLNLNNIVTKKMSPDSEVTFCSFSSIVCNSEPVGKEDVESNDCKVDGTVSFDTGTFTNTIDLLANIIHDSVLIPFIQMKMRVDSFLEISQHTRVYLYIVNIIKILASQPQLALLLYDAADEENSVYSLIKKLEKEVKCILVRINKTSANGNIPKSRKAKEDVSINKEPPPSYVQFEEEALAREFYCMIDTVTMALANIGILPSSSSTKGDERETASPVLSPTQKTDISEQYKEALKDLQFVCSDIEVDGACAHHFSKIFKKAIHPNSSQVTRIAQEMVSLQTSLPLDARSAIFICTCHHSGEPPEGVSLLRQEEGDTNHATECLRKFEELPTVLNRAIKLQFQDDAKFTLLRALIIGPEGTPYSGGCFLFDIFFPKEYPFQPPLVHFCTTGGGRVTFNPNLYSCGKVCLSLLGTWSGKQGEHWVPTSTLLQVLISIQSLILVPEPFYNEPGFEAFFGKPTANAKSLSYNYGVLVNTITHAMISTIKRPPSCFKKVIRTHFQIKKKVILEEIQEFANRYPGEKDALIKAYKELKSEFSQLPNYHP